MLYNKIKDGSSTIDYDSPSWAFKQADELGYNRALKEVIQLINVSDRETP